MKFKEIVPTKDTIMAINRFITERLSWMNMTKASPVELMISQICVLEVKVDSLMNMLGDKNDIDFKMFDAYLNAAAKDGADTAVSTVEKLKQEELRKKLTV